MQVAKMEVSKTIEVKGGKNYREVVGTVEYTTPILSDIIPFVASAEIDEDAMKEAAKAKDFDGLPIYKDPKANWVFGAIVAAVKAGARNKLAPGSIELKSAENPIPTDWEGFTDSATGRGPSAALAILRDCKAAWAGYVAKLGKTEKTSAMLIMYFTNRTALAAQPAEARDKMLKYVEEFAVSLSEEDADKYTKPIEAVMGACTEGNEAGDDF